MITKIKKFLSKVTKIEWILLGFALVALFVALTHTHSSHEKPHHGGKKPVKAGTVEAEPVK